MADTRPRRVHWLVKAFAFGHMAFVLHWTLPQAANAIENGSIPPTPQNVASHPVDFALAANNWARWASPTRYYGTCTGIWQYWDMFAPNPASVDLWHDARVTYQDGTSRIVPYPRMKSLSIGEKFVKERYRKYLERVNNEVTDTWKWPQFAQRMALLGFTDPSNPPVQVELRRHFREVKGPSQPVPQDYLEYTYFTYVVDQTKLRGPGQ